MSTIEDCDKDASSTQLGNESVVADSRPVIFQCCQCETIVGDSTSWVTSNKSRRTITLGRVSSKVEVRPEVQLSPSGFDKGSTYQLVYCLSCDENLGQQYLASPPGFDYIRGCFTLSVEKLNSYEVGSGSSNVSGLEDMLNVPSPQYMLQRMDQMQSVIISMNERLHQLETCMVGTVPVQQQNIGTSHSGMRTSHSDVGGTSLGMGASHNTMRTSHNGAETSHNGMGTSHKRMETSLSDNMRTSQNGQGTSHNETESCQYGMGTSQNGMGTNDDVQSITSSENLSTTVQTHFLGSSKSDIHRNSYIGPTSRSAADKITSRQLALKRHVYQNDLLIRKGLRPHKGQAQRKRKLRHQ